MLGAHGRKAWGLHKALATSLAKNDLYLRLQRLRQWFRGLHGHTVGSTPCVRVHGSPGGPPKQTAVCVTIAKRISVNQDVRCYEATLMAGPQAVCISLR